MDADALALALAERLATVVPPGVTVVAQGPSVWTSDPSGLGQSEDVGALLDQAGDRGDLVAIASRAVLDAVQDQVCEWTTEPWPYWGMALPYAQVRNEQLILGFGDPDCPSPGLDPIDLRALRPDH